MIGNFNIRCAILRRVALRAVREFVYRARQSLRAEWEHHRELVRDNPAYAAAIAGGAALIVAQVELERFALALLTTIVSIWSAIRRGQRPAPWPRQPLERDFDYDNVI